MYYILSLPPPLLSLLPSPPLPPFSSWSPGVLSSGPTPRSSTYTIPNDAASDHTQSHTHCGTNGTDFYSELNYQQLTGGFPAPSNYEQCKEPCPFSQCGGVPLQYEVPVSTLDLETKVGVYCGRGMWPQAMGGACGHVMGGACGHMLWEGHVGTLWVGHVATCYGRG